MPGLLKYKYPRTADTAAQLAYDNNITFANASSLPPVRPTDECFNFSPVSCEDVRRAILSLPLNKAPGQDKVKAKVIRDCLQVVLGQLTEIINYSLCPSTFPSDWKVAEVIPLLKEGDHEIKNHQTTDHYHYSTSLQRCVKKLLWNNLVLTLSLTTASPPTKTATSHST